MMKGRPGLVLLFSALAFVCHAQEGGSDSSNKFKKVLDTVRIVTKKPFYEVKPDRVIVNVQSSIASAGNSVLDVLERSPGVVVNRQGGTIALSIRCKKSSLCKNISIFARSLF